MKTVLFLFIALFLIIKGKQLKNCPCLKHCLPGIEKVGVGMNMIEGKPTGLSIFDFQCEKNKEFTYRNTRYGFYDQINVISEPQAQSESKVFKTTEEYQKYLTDKVGGGISWKLFSLSAEIKNVQNIVSNRENVYTETKESYNLYSATLLTDITQTKQDDEFLKQLNVLPRTFDNRTLPRYLNFIKKFGTHVVTSSVLGGIGTVQTSVKTSYYNEVKEDGVKLQASAEFFFLKVHAESERSNRSNSTNFIKNSSIKTSIQGGQPLALKDWEKWVPSIIEDPIRVTYKVQPIYRCLKTSHPLRENLKNAIEIYIQRNQMQEPTTVPNCRHIIFSEKPPENQEKTIGNFNYDFFERPCSPQHKAYIVPGPDSYDRCLVSYSYFHGRDNILIGENGISYSSKVEVFAHRRRGGFNTNCGNWSYFTTKYTLGTGWSCTTTRGQDPNVYDYRSCDGTATVPKGEVIKSTIKQDCYGISCDKHLASLGFIMQPRIIPKE